MTMNKSFESLESSKNGDLKGNSTDFMDTNASKQHEKDSINFLPLVPSLPAMRLPQNLKKPFSKYDSVQ